MTTTDKIEALAEVRERVALMATRVYANKDKAGYSDGFYHGLLETTFMLDGTILRLKTEGKAM